MNEDSAPVMGVVIMLYAEELNERVMLELSEILLFCETCEHQILELLKVANCVFSCDEFYELIDGYKIFKSNVVILENLMIQVDAQITMLQVVAVRSAIRELKKNFDQLIGMLELANIRIDDDEIDFESAQLIHELLDVMTFDVIDDDDFEEASQAAYFVPQLLNPQSDGYNERYGELTVLVIESFKTRHDAYVYALKNGISKDQVWSMYE